jgi:uncharacterized protein (TIGR02118 family)
MYILTITYPRSGKATFDFDYFRSKHVPEMSKAFGPFGLGWASILKGEQSVDGKDPAYFVTTILSFREEQGARDAVASEGGKRVMEDIANFTTAKPVMQFNTSVP